MSGHLRQPGTASLIKSPKISHDDSQFLLSNQEKWEPAHWHRRPVQSRESKAMKVSTRVMPEPASENLLSEKYIILSCVTHMYIYVRKDMTSPYME